MPSIPISPFGGSDGGVCGPWWKGHAHRPGHWLEELPTQMKVVPVLWSEPWTAQWFMQKSSTATSYAVNISVMPLLGVPAYDASCAIWDTLRYLPHQFQLSAWFTMLT